MVDTIPKIDVLIPASVDPTTTAEENRVTAGQRKVNLIWEYTQSSVALLVTLATLNINIILIFKDQYSEALQMMSNAFFLIIGFYFGRTNHQRIGGVGNNNNNNSSSRYEGR